MPTVGGTADIESQLLWRRIGRCGVRYVAIVHASRIRLDPVATRTGDVFPRYGSTVPGPLSSAVTQLIATTAEELFVTQSELGRRTGINQKKISRTFRGERDITLDELASICDALGLSMLAVINEAEAGLR